MKHNTNQSELIQTNTYQYKPIFHEKIKYEQFGFNTNSLYWFVFGMYCPIEFEFVLFCIEVQYKTIHTLMKHNTNQSEPIHTNTS